MSSQRFYCYKLFRRFDSKGNLIKKYLKIRCSKKVLQEGDHFFKTFTKKLLQKCKCVSVNHNCLSNNCILPLDKIKIGEIYNFKSNFLERSFTGTVTEKKKMFWIKKRKHFYPIYYLEIEIIPEMVYFYAYVECNCVSNLVILD